MDVLKYILSTLSIDNIATALSVQEIVCKVQINNKIDQLHKFCQQLLYNSITTMMFNKSLLILTLIHLVMSDVTWDQQVPLAPGVTWSRTVMTDLPMGGNQTVNVIEVDLVSASVEIRPILQVG